MFYEAYLKLSVPAPSNLDSIVKAEIRRQSKKLQIQGAQILKNEAYLQYAAMAKDTTQHRSWTFYEAVNLIARCFGSTAITVEESV
ncbi:MAG: hypothetical protein CL941_06680 [Desulfobacter sp.]|nr:hypothetical protein [Desulfobacter sp.]